MKPKLRGSHSVPSVLLGKLSGLVRIRKARLQKSILVELSGGTQPLPLSQSERLQKGAECAQLPPWLGKGSPSLPAPASKHQQDSQETTDHDLPCSSFETRKAGGSQVPPSAQPV